MGRTQTIAIYHPENRTIVGWPDEVAAVLRTAEREGRLLTDPRRVAESIRHRPDGRVRCTAVLMMPQAPVTRAPNRLWRGIGTAVAASAVLLAAFYALGVLLIALVGPVPLTAALVVLTASAWVALSARRRHACRGMHCPACPRR